MRKVLGFTAAMALTLTLPALAGERVGTIRYVDTANHMIILDDGTQLWVSDGQMSGLSQGSQVKASYEMQGPRSVVTTIAPTAARPDGIVDPLRSEEEPGD